MDVTRQDISFLGREFLTWLWFKSEERNGSIHLPGKGDIEIIFLQRLVLESGEGAYSETVVCQGLHADLTEGKAALREGKKIKEARIRLSMGEQQWEFTFKADDFHYQTLKLPLTMNLAEEEDDKEGRILERIYLTESMVNVMEHLFSLFLEKRLAPEWTSEEVPRIKKWSKENG